MKKSEKDANSYHHYNQRTRFVYALNNRRTKYYAYNVKCIFGDSLRIKNPLFFFIHIIILYIMYNCLSVRAVLYM